MPRDPMHPVADRRDRTLHVDGLVNGRDLGGLRLAGGGETPTGVFFRSESLHRLTPAGWSQIREAGIRTVVDLRQQAERDEAPVVAPDWLTTIHVDHDGLDNTGFWADYWSNGLVGTAIYYLPHLAAMPERTTAVLQELVNAPRGGVLFHCAGGRDRTGLVSMILLRAAGVVDEDIVDDYLETVRHGSELAASRNRNNPEPEMEALCRAHGTSTEGAFRDALAGLDLDAVLDAGALSAADREGLATWRGAMQRDAMQHFADCRP